MRHDDPELEALQEEMFGTRKDGLAPYTGLTPFPVAALVPAITAAWLGLVLGAVATAFRQVAR